MFRDILIIIKQLSAGVSGLSSTQSCITKIKIPWTLFLVLGRPNYPRPFEVFCDLLPCWQCKERSRKGTNQTFPSVVKGRNSVCPCPTGSAELDNGLCSAIFCFTRHRGVERTPSDILSAAVSYLPFRPSIWHTLWELEGDWLGDFWAISILWRHKASIWVESCYEFENLLKGGLIGQTDTSCMCHRDWHERVSSPKNIVA